MNTSRIVLLGMVGALALGNAGMRGGCTPEPCPDLNIACPDLECADGFKVDKSGCAICECVGEVLPPPIDCYDNSECPDGQYCQFDLVAACYHEGEADCAPLNRGTCTERESCQDLDEEACFADVSCEPVYEEIALPCYHICADDDPDCGCYDRIFVGCREATEPECWGAWLDENGNCRTPADGVYPDYCCQQMGCSSDQDCDRGEFCDFSGRYHEDDSVSDAPWFGVCRPIEEPECYSDSDCAEGFHCELMYGEYEADEARMVAPGGICVRDAEPECYSDSDCAEGFHCELMYGEYEADEARLVAPGGICVRDTQTECYSDRDCAEGFYCEVLWDDAGDEPGFREVPGICLPVEEPVCYFDSDCPEGYYCETTDTALSGDPAGLVAPEGVCLPIEETECHSDEDCAEGFYCDYSLLEGTSGDEAGMRYYMGICRPVENLTCSELDEAACVEASGCEAIFLDLPCNADCIEGEPDCPCGPVFAGCEEARPEGECQTDADCAGGFCEHFDTCTAIGCPEPAPSICVSPSCDDGSELACWCAQPECGESEVAAVIDGCWSCVDARSCTPQGDERQDWGCGE